MNTQVPCRLMLLSILAAALLVFLSAGVTQATSLLSNGGFETGDLSQWEIGAGLGVVTGSTNEMDPSGPQSGSFFFSASNADGADRQGENVISIFQTVDVSSFGFIGSGKGRVAARGFFSGAPGGGSSSSDDLAQIVVEFYENGSGGNPLGTVSTTLLDPIVGFWNEVSIPTTPVPPGADTIVYHIRTELDPGFNSIDIGGDGLSLGLWLAGDFDGDGDVDGADFLVWQRGGLPDPISAADLVEWKLHFGTGSATLAAAVTEVPEPGPLFSGVLGLLFAGSRCRTRAPCLHGRCLQSAQRTRAKPSCRPPHLR